MMKRYKVFIDGQSGTTGLQVTQRLSQHEDIKILEIASEDRKKPEAKKTLMKESNVALLCLPDKAVDDSIQLAAEANTRVIDASSVNRVKDGWVYGLPELSSEQRNDIKNARQVANPGCYATGAILILKPLIASGFLNPAEAINVFGASGYTGGGNAMVAHYEQSPLPSAFSLYGLTLNHKQIPEIQKWSGLEHRPIFLPSVVNHDQGMHVIIPIDAIQCKQPTFNILELLSSYYENEALVRVRDDLTQSTFLHIEGLKNSCYCDIYFEQKNDQYLFVSKLDNLGKGASGAAVQNLNIMLGLPETLGVHLP
ncbi:MAG: N-acetyl-gamma-glutamyl-phosphate reductase [Sedimenticola sp.]